MSTRRITLLISILWCTCLASAQSITGRIVDSKQEPIEAATVIAQAPDSTFSEAAITDAAGIFIIKKAPEKYRLILQHMLYVTQRIDGSTPDIGTITMKEQDFALNEVVVKGERLIVKVEDGALTYNMSNIIEKKVISNAYESVLQLPGIIEQNEAITLAGANGVTIILNGKPTTMSNEQLYELLKSTSASNIEKIQVMYSAPAKYHVRGAAINIITRKKHSDTPYLQGEINGSYIQKYSTSGQGGMNLSYASPKLSVDFMYSAAAIKNKTQLDLTTRHTLQDQIFEMEQNNRGQNKNLTHNIRLAGDYSLSNDDKLSLSYTTSLSPNGRNIEKSSGNISNSTNNKDFDNSMHNISVSYAAHNDLNIGADYTYYKSLFYQNFKDTKADETVTSFTSDSRQKIDRIKLYADKSLELPKDWSLNYGGEFMYAANHNMQKYNPEADMADLNSDSNIKEYTYNIYAGFDKSFSEKFSISLSAIGEYYKLANYTNWAIYPTCDITYMPSPEHIIQLSFSSDKTYPDYWDMQESVGYLNGYAEIHGNPYLKPSKDYSAQLIYVLKSKYQFVLYFDYEPNHFEQLGYLSPDRLALIYKTTNWDYKKMLGLNIAIPFNIGSVLDSRLTLNGYNNASKCNDFYDTPFNRNKWTLYSRMDNTINLSSKPNIKIELSAMYMTPSIQGIYDLEKIWSVNAGIKWSFANEKAEFLIKGTDLFNSTVPNVKTRYKSQYMDMLLTPDSRAVTVSFKYKFGGYKDKKIKEIDTSRFGQK